MTSIIAEFDEVSKLYGTFAALRKISLQLERGRCYLVLGPNGAGKSTLLRAIVGLLKTRAETVTFDGRPIGCQTTFFPANSASLVLNGKTAEGTPWRMDRGGKPSTTACLAWCETWFRP